MWSYMLIRYYGELKISLAYDYEADARRAFRNLTTEPASGVSAIRVYRIAFDEQPTLIEEWERDE